MSQASATSRELTLLVNHTSMQNIGETSFKVENFVKVSSCDGPKMHIYF